MSSFNKTHSPHLHRLHQRSKEGVRKRLLSREARSGEDSLTFLGQEDREDMLSPEG
jgi:hypothetical protein